MKWEDFFTQLANALKIPETLEETKEFVKNDSTCQVTIEDLAFKQVVINILVAANIISEQDFNDSVAHFKELLVDEFAERLLQIINQNKEKADDIFGNNQLQEDDLNLDFDLDEEDDPSIGKA